MHLVYVHPGTVAGGEGGLHLDGKTESGLRQYAASWPGRITAVVRATEKDGVGEGAFEKDGYTIVVARDVKGAIAALRPSAVLALHRHDSDTLLGLGFPVVLTSENSITERTAQQLVRASSPLDRARVRVGAHRLERSFRRSARRAAGLQCNGFAAWDAYAHENRNPFFFHDHRITQEDLDATEESPVWDGSRPLRVAFSGRLTAIKGPQYALQMAHELGVRRAPVEIVFLGEGEQRGSLEGAAPPNTSFLGVLDFETQWKSYVRENVDVMVLPHPQGDPSCTYFEALGCGAPILGFANSTLAPLVDRSEAGWVVHGASELSRAVFDLLDHPERISSARDAGLAYMHGNDFENVASERVRHILESVR